MLLNEPTKDMKADFDPALEVDQMDQMEWCSKCYEKQYHWKRDPPFTPNPMYYSGEYDFGKLCRIGITMLAAMLIFTDFNEYFEIIRVYFTFITVFLYINYAFYLILNGWALYLLEICHVMTIINIYAWWTITPLPTEFYLGWWLTCTGPVGGASTVLAVPAIFHENYCFGSFWIHYVLMWYAYGVRWRWDGFKDSEFLEYDLPTLMMSGAYMYYLKWQIGYFAVLALKPFLPGVRRLCTTYDEKVHDGDPDGDLNENYFLGLLKKLLYMFRHAAGATIGYFVGGLQFQSKNAMIAFLTGIFFSTVYFAYDFHYKCTQGARFAAPCADHRFDSESIPTSEPKTPKTVDSCDPEKKKKKKIVAVSILHQMTEIQTEKYEGDSDAESFEMPKTAPSSAQENDIAGIISMLSAVGFMVFVWLITDYFKF